VFPGDWKNNGLKIELVPDGIILVGSEVATIPVDFDRLLKEPKVFLPPEYVLPILDRPTDVIAISTGRANLDRMPPAMGLINGPVESWRHQIRFCRRRRPRRLH